MVVICKRFGMDDVPVRYFDGCKLKDVVTIARGMIRVMPCTATSHDERLAHANIGTELAALLVVNFDKDGFATSSVVVV